MPDAAFIAWCEGRRSVSGRIQQLRDALEALHARHNMENMARAAHALRDTAQVAQQRQGDITAAVDAAMVEMQNIHPPLRRSECERLIRAALEGQQPQAEAVPSIPLTPAEIQSGFDRVRWAEGLIRQLPEDHDGRNSWLLNYGFDKEERQAAWAKRRAAPPVCPTCDDAGFCIKPSECAPRIAAEMVIKHVAADDSEGGLT